MKHRATYLALRVAVSVLGLLPEPVMRHLGRLGGLVWYLLDTPRRRTAQRHMARVGASPQAALEMFTSYGRYWAESFWVRPRRFDQMRDTMEVDGLEHLEAARANGQGVVLALPHIGNWEAAALIGLDIGLPIVAVAERLSNPLITEWFTRQRAMFGIEIVLTGKGLSSRRRLGEAIKEGAGVALLCDRDLSGRGIAVDFFDEETTLPSGPASLALKSKAPLLVVGIFFQKGAGHRAVINKPIYVPGSSNGDQPEVAELTQQVAGELESMVRLHPGQWHLLQPNWPSDRT